MNAVNDEPLQPMHEAMRAQSRTNRKTSYANIFRTSAITGGSSIATTVIAVVRAKVIAVTLGASGIGLLGLISALQSTSASFAGLGLTYSGVREVASVVGDRKALERVRSALILANVVLGVLAVLLMWVLRFQISTATFGDRTRGWEVGFIGIGVGLTLLTGYQAAVLQGTRRIKDLAMVQILSAAFTTAAGLVLILLLRDLGILLLVVCTPFVTILIGQVFISRIQPRAPMILVWTTLAPHLRSVFALGVSCMGVAVMSGFAGLTVRSLLTRKLGIAPAGQFSAAWAISTQYIGFLLAAMAADYYPRLSNVIHLPAEARELVTQQTEVALLLGAPALLLIFSLTPWIIPLLYSRDFVAAVPIARWQIIGCVIKLASWPLTYILLAQARPKAFFLVEFAWNASYIGVIWLFLSNVGPNITGIAFFVSCSIHFALTYSLSRVFLGYKWPVFNWAVLAASICVALSVSVASAHTYVWTGLIGTGASVAFAVLSMSRLASHLQPESRFSRLYKFVAKARTVVPFSRLL